MTDKTPGNLTRKEAQAVREWAERAWRTKVQDAVVAHAARVLLAVLPPHPTLADMTDEERDACRWAQADTESWGRVVILNPCAIGGNVTLVDDRGAVIPENHARVTPRPDLPRMAWPGDLTYIDTGQGDDTPTAPDHLAVGTVIESADDPRIDTLPVGSILLDRDEEATMKRPWEWEGEGYIPIPSDGAKFGPWTVLHIPKEKA